MDHERHMNLARFTKYNDEKEIFKIIPWLQTIYINHWENFLSIFGGHRIFVNFSSWKKVMGLTPTP